MPFIAEAQIEAVAEKLDAQPEDYIRRVEAFQQNQPELMAYLLSEDTAFLTQEEQDYMLYLGLVIWEVVRSQREIPRMTAEQIGKVEDHNWKKLEGATAKTFRERMDVFFVNYPQEDLLAFVEDALIPDEESPITKEGREPLFVALKTVIDVIAI